MAKLPKNVRENKEVYYSFEKWIIPAGARSPTSKKVKERGPYYW